MVRLRGAIAGGHLARCCPLLVTPLQAFSSLVFSQNSSYQLSFCVLILVCAFAAQMRYMPYMPQVRCQWKSRQPVAVSSWATIR